MSGNRPAKPVPRRAGFAVWQPKRTAAKSAQKKPAVSGKKPKRRALFGLLKRKEKWVLSWRGRFVALAARWRFWRWAFILGFIRFWR